MDCPENLNNRDPRPSGESVAQSDGSQVVNSPAIACWADQPTLSRGFPGRGFPGRWLGAFADLLLPPTCTFCGRGLPPPRTTSPPTRSADSNAPQQQPPRHWDHLKTTMSVQLCQLCQEKLLGEPDAMCSRCASPRPNVPGPGAEPTQDGCPRCHGRKYRFQATVALGTYQDELQEAVLRTKSQQHESLMMALGQLLAGRISDRFGACLPDILVPVPMYWWRKMARGTSAAETLCDSVSAELRLPCSHRAVVCRRKVKKQGTLSRSERFLNVRHAFAMSRGIAVTDRTVLLLDDIMTTGATANEVAKVLRRAGAKEVWVAVVARGTGVG